ncbi:LysM peptidoglycan-binding domain-containing protein [Vibrio sp. ZSDE26]|uniref:LysM peptidoglycan-binding domain-containing protein n=1 Tax=Vibrio amylolyticus TaxID=2847292 RepID=A0A9X2BNF5_9VIBR|nr:LysM domain-containing protein [Vibrio amylolyticus]MCK6265868.1 LysM peptidoglycan-binding domain-containing protein [Vibrio amylolyticus]
MSKTYLVKPGDTLLQIAIEQNTQFNTLLELNPKFQINPDLIKVGEAVILPDEEELEPIEPTYLIEPVQAKTPDECGDLVAGNLCSPMEVHDVIFITGDGPTAYLTLDEEAAQQLKEEADKTDTFITSYKELCEAAPDKKSATKQEMDRHAQARQSWFEEAKYIGIFSEEEKEPSRATARVAGGTSAPPKVNPNHQQVEAQLTVLKSRLKFVENYDDRWFGENSVDTLRTEVTSRIQTKIDYYKTLSVKSSAQPVIPENVTKLSVGTDRFNSEGKQATTQRSKRHVMEVYSVNQGRTVYIRSSYYEEERKRWKPSYKRTKAMKALEVGDVKGFGKAVAQDIRDDFRTKKLTDNLDAKLAEWNADGYKYKEWQAKKSFNNDEGETTFAVSAEAQLFRWGAQASVNASKDLKDQQLNAGVGAASGFSLVEAKAEVNQYIPYERGYPVKLSYLDANKQPAEYSFGCFRLNASMTIGCFAGAMIQGAAQASNKPEENGESVGVMYTPKVNLSKSPKGNIGFKAEGFAGVQATGALAGNMEWEPPKKDTAVKFEILAQLKGEGNIAAGGGFGADFQLSLVEGSFYLKCTGQFIWGVGGGGGFGALIDTRHLWELVKVIWQGLQYVDYRVLRNIDKNAYNYLVNSTIIAFATDYVKNPIQALQNVVTAGVSKVDVWVSRYQESRDREKMASLLASRILNDSCRSGIPFHQLPPEAVGIMLDILVEQFAFNLHEEQESAICKLLAETTYSWHKFEEILQRMNELGKPRKGDRVLFDNLARINSILDGTQQRQFNQWVSNLAEADKVDSITMVPYSPLFGESLERKRALISTQVAKLGFDDGSRVV